MKRKPEKLLALLLTMVILFIYQSVPVAAAAEKPAESKTAGVFNQHCMQFNRVYNNWY